MNINPTPPLFATFTSSDPLPTPPASAKTSAPVQTTDISGISPAASFLNELSQLQQQNPDQFSQVLTQITDRLKQAAQDASSKGDAQKAGELNQLATAFQNAASSGQLPTVQQLQQAGLTGHHHHHGGHHHGGGAKPQSATTPSSTDQSTTAASTNLVDLKA
jgi:hypothetical protein